MRVLSKNFFERPVLVVAEDLLGKYLVRKIDKKSPTLRGLPKAMREKLSSKGGGFFMITEVEAYDGSQDKASHARFGLTKRNAPMFEQGGRWYVYFTYGMHWLLNIVTGVEGKPSAILIRGVGDINGPARITRKLKIDKSLNNQKASRKSGLWIAAPKGRASLRKSEAGRFKIKRLPRVGVVYAGPVWSKKRWRFLLVT